MQLLMVGGYQRGYLRCAGAGGTAAILLGGLLAFKKVSVLASSVSRVRPLLFQSVLIWLGLQGNQNLSQHMMRARVVAQVSSSLLVATLVSACVLLGFQWHHGITPGPSMASQLYA